MQDQKVVKKLISSVSSTLVAAITLVGASFAWFSNNRNVDSGGLQMQIEAMANLVISKTSVEISAANYMTSSIDFDSNENQFAPCTHDNGSTTGLKYVTNTNEIDIITGTQRAETPLEYADAVNVNEGIQYYFDQTVYVASSSKEFTNVTLNASIASAKKGDADIESGSLMATSIDFYLVAEDDSLTYYGTTNVATKSEVVIELADDTIPLNASGYVTILMRSYFDGALEKSTGKAYVNTATVDLSQATINVTFTAKDIVADSEP